MLLTTTIGLLLLIAAGGCQTDTGEEAEHHFPAHQPIDYPSAVARMREVHQEILDGPLVARDAPVLREHHGHDDHDDAEPEQLDALLEMSDLVNWLPDLAADSELEEEPWNRVYSISNRLQVITRDASALAGSKRRESYLRHEGEIEQHLRQLLEITERFANTESSLSAVDP